MRELVSSQCCDNKTKAYERGVDKQQNASRAQSGIWTVVGIFDVKIIRCCLRSRRRCQDWLSKVACDLINRNSGLINWTAFAKIYNFSKRAILCAARRQNAR